MEDCTATFNYGEDVKKPACQVKNREEMLCCIAENVQ